MVSQYGPDYIINCAAYTAVDAAEENEQTARAINAQAVKILADAALQAGARMIHISTDYVFAGTHFTPYTEDDLPDPQSVYGLTKLEGEQLLRETLPEQSVIMRTAWLYSPFGKNFVKTMLRLAREKDHVNVVCDQIGTPTCALTLGIAILAVIDCPQWHPGIFNLTDQGVASWYDLAEATMRLAGVTDCTVIPVTTEEYPTRAIRPAYSVLSKKNLPTLSICAFPTGSALLSFASGKSCRSNNKKSIQTQIQ